MIPTATIAWKERKLIIIDQTLLPNDVKFIELETEEDVWEAIKVLRVRGAPAIGVCAAYGVVVAALHADAADTASLKRHLADVITYLAGSRPTAVNLFYALDRMKKVMDGSADNMSREALLDALEAEANRICEEDLAMCRAIGEYGAPLIGEGSSVLTHCNAGGLATSGYGTALAPMYIAHEQGRTFHVFADETRPLLQGARLTAWELTQAGIDVTLLCDNMAAQVMREGRVQLVIVGADRIAANGDAANKIGTYGVAVSAKMHNIPFYVAAPSSTFDVQTRTGDDIPIEQRDRDEVACWGGHKTAPDHVNIYNPAFDITPSELITAFITDRGILKPPYTPEIVRLTQ